MKSHRRGIRIRKTECSPYPELAVYRHRYLLKVQQNLRKNYSCSSHGPVLANGIQQYSLGMAKRIRIIYNQKLH